MFDLIECTMFDELWFDIGPSVGRFNSFTPVLVGVVIEGRVVAAHGALSAVVTGSNVDGVFVAHRSFVAVVCC